MRTGQPPAWLSVVLSVLLVCVAGVPAAPAAGKERSTKGPHVDRSFYPKAYGVLGDERLMYPVDMSDWPVKITSERQLFLDDYLIASRSKLTRRLHPLQRHKSNPLVRLWEKPWERSFGNALFVIRDAKTGQFRMWYNLLNGIQDESKGLRYRGPMCYATSADGIHWTKPNLGIFKYGKDKNNNITLPQGTIEGLFYEPDEPDPKRRYKALVWHDPHGQKDYAPREGFYLYWSPDGLHWTGDNQRCVMPNGQGWNFPTDPLGGVGDTTNFRWDHKLRKYICNAKVLFRNPSTLRTAGQCESDDLIHWTRPRMIVHRDGLDEGGSQMYEHITFPYESMWIGHLRVMHGGKGVIPKRPIKVHRPGWKQVEVELTASRDGRHWTRVCRGQRFLPLGGKDDWDADYLPSGRPGEPLLIDGKLWFYYWGAIRPERFTTMGWPNPRNDMHIGLATLRRDGFVSLNAGQTPGLVVTRPMTFQSGKLFVNAEVGPGGYVKAELCGRSGKAIGPYTLSACKPATTDATSIPITWAGQGAIRHSPDQSLRLAFELKNAKLYAFWIE